MIYFTKKLCAVTGLPINRYKDKMVILSDLQVHWIKTQKTSIENWYCFYRDIIYGKKVQITTKTHDEIQQQTIELERMKNR